jgi:hypothetical protein
MDLSEEHYLCRSVDPIPFLRARIHALHSDNGHGLADYIVGLVVMALPFYFGWTGSPGLIPNGMTDEQALFLGDIFPTGWMAADTCEIERPTSSRYGEVAPLDSSASKAR